MNADVVRERLDYATFFGAHVKRLQRKGNGEATGLCPFHDDQTASLSVNLAAGLFNCFACHATGDAFTFYRKLKGVDFPSAVRELGALVGLADKPPTQRVVDHFDYHDAESKLLYTKERIEPGRDGRRKEFRFFHVGAGGKRQTGRGCDAVLYRLPDVLRAKCLIIVEGEAKADLLASWGLPATCLDTGVGSKLTEAMIQQLAGKRIVILPDNDEPGREYANRLASQLYRRAASLRIVELPGLPEKGDILDWTRE